MGDTAAAIAAALQQIESPYQAETTILGPSKIISYLNCPRAYKLQYIDRVHAARGAEAVLGTAIHAVIAYSHEAGWGPADRRTAADMLVDIWESVDAAGMVRADDPAVELAYRSARDTWLPWYLHWSDGQQTVAVEERWELEWDGVPLRGTIDRVYVDGAPVVSDIKSGKRAPTAVQMTTHLQLSIYDWAFRCIAGDQPHALEIVHLRGQETYRTSRSAEYIEHVMRDVVGPVARQIEHATLTGDWPCNPGTLWGCSYCVYQHACPVGQGGDSENGC